MESNEIRAQIREAERAAAAPHLTSADSPWWYAAFLGLVGPILAFTTSQALVTFNGGTSTWPLIPALTAALIALFVVLDQRRRRGTSPSGPPPHELRTVYRWYYTGAVILIIAVSGLALVTPLAVSVPVGYALAAGGFAWYTVACKRAAERVRARLA